MSLEWFSEQAKARVERALLLGIDKTTSDGAITAKRLVNRETTTLQGSIYPEPAVVASDGSVYGIYGPHDVEYAVPQEFLPGEQAPEFTAGGKTYPAGTRKRSGGKPYMRPSYEEAKQKVKPNIAAAYRGLP